MDFSSLKMPPKQYERIPLLSVSAPYADLQNRLQAKTKDRKFAILTRIPTPDYCYYPIPYYAALFKGKWYDIKRLIAVAKEAKLRNAAPIKYQIEVSAKYWDSKPKRKWSKGLQKLSEILRPLEHDFS